MCNKLNDEMNVLKDELQQKLGERVFIDEKGVHNEILFGKYVFSNTSSYYGDSIDFCIYYIKNELLRLTVGEVQEKKSYLEKMKAFNTLLKTLSTIKVNDNMILEKPLVFYDTLDDSIRIPTADWVFSEKEEYKREILRSNENNISNVMVFDSKFKIKKLFRVSNYI